MNEDFERLKEDGIPVYFVILYLHSLGKTEVFSVKVTCLSLDSNQVFLDFK
jgi:hypothetical protein